MRKVMLLAAMLAMVLAAAAPAFAQATAVQYDGDDETSTFCNQVQNVSGITQAQYGDANAAATDDSEAIANAANELGVSQQQVLNCIVGDDNDGNVQGGANADDGSIAVGVADVDDDGDGVVDEADGTENTGSASASASAESDDSSSSASASSESSSSATASSTTTELPETGGASLLALGAGALLVAGGLLARRIVR